MRKRCVYVKNKKSNLKFNLQYIALRSLRQETPKAIAQLKYMLTHT